MLTIGFTNHYYTLWSVHETEKWDSARRLTYITTHYQYRQNLSMDFEAAKVKIQNMVGEGNEYAIDLELRGEQGRYYTKTRISKLDPWQFTFGQLQGYDIRESSDIWQLNRAMQQEVGGRRRVYARRRLIELGELIRYDWIEKTTQWRSFTEEEKHEQLEEWDQKQIIVEVKHKWCPKKLYEWKIKKDAEDQLMGHYFTDGERVSLSIKRIAGRSFDTSYGTTFIITYLTTDNKTVLYMGSNPPDISTEEFEQVKATIKHDQYKDVKQTKLQRIKK